MTVEMPPGPPCDGCGQEAAVMSVMNYADYSQIKLGPNCGPDFLRTIADTIDGGQTNAAAREALEAAAAFAADDQAAELAELATDDQDAPETGSKSDHWASTTNVRRSTHGHRSTTRAASSARKDEPE